MLGSGALFGPIMADGSLWFRRRRGLAVAIAAAGNYVAGAVWPPIVAAVMGLPALALGPRAGGSRATVSAGAWHPDCID